MAGRGGREQFKDTDWNKQHRELARERGARRPQQTFSAALDETGNLDVVDALEMPGGPLGGRGAGSSGATPRQPTAGDAARSARR